VTSVPPGKQPTGKVATGKTPVVLPPPVAPSPSRVASRVLTGVGIGLVILAAGVAAVVVSSGDDDPTVTAADDGSETAGPASSASEDSEDDLEGGEEVPPSTSTSTTTTVAPEDDLPPGEWAAVLFAATSFGPADEVRAELSRFGDVRVLDSNAYTTLKPGFFVVYVGGFLRSSGALDYCRAIGRYDRERCHARYLSRDPSVASWNTPGTDDARPEFIVYP